MRSGPLKIAGKLGAPAIALGVCKCGKPARFSRSGEGRFRIAPWRGIDGRKATEMAIDGYLRRGLGEFEVEDTEPNPDTKDRRRQQ